MAVQPGGRGQPANKKPAASNPGETAGPDEAMRTIALHPRFGEAVRHMLNNADRLHDADRLLDRFVNDRGQLIGGLLACYLHACSLSEGDEPGFSLRRFQMVCVEQKLCSFGRARALVLLMCVAGYLTPGPSLWHRRQRRLVPTARLLQLQQRKWRYQLAGLAMVSDRGAAAVASCGRPEFILAFVRQLGASYTAGFRLLDHAPELAHLAECKAGLRLILYLSLLAPDQVGPHRTSVAVSVSALAARFGVARAHVRSLIAAAAIAGLVERAGDGTTLTVLPGLMEAVGHVMAALLGLLAHCAGAAAEEMAQDRGPARLPAGGARQLA